MEARRKQRGQNRQISDIARAKTLTTDREERGEETVNGILAETENPLARKPLYLLGKTGFEHRRKDKIPELPW